MPTSCVRAATSFVPTGIVPRFIRTTYKLRAEMYATQGEAIALGSFVKIKPKITPMRGWAGILPGEIGRVLTLRGRLATVVFEHQKFWRAYVDELEEVEVEELVLIRDEGPYRRYVVVWCMRDMLLCG